MNEILSLLTTQDLSIGYKSGGSNKTVSENLNLELQPGQLVCLLGPNGAGKSTLMRSLAGLQPIISGHIYVDKKSLNELNPNELAKKLSLVLTERIEAGNLTVNDVVTLGRTPYTGWLGRLSALDKEKVNWALQATETSAYKHRQMHQLSDGERQKVMLARALAQDTDLILLDEPTAHLDLPSRVEIMHLLHTLARQTNKAILISTHELDLALQAADQLWVIDQHGKMATGVPEDLVLNGSFQAAFAKNGFNFDRSSGTFTIHKEEVSLHASVSGSPDSVFWTKRALQREGIGISPEPDENVQILMEEESNSAVWKLNWFGTTSLHATLESLLNEIRKQK